MSDAEIDETRLWAGGNLFTTSRRGALVRTGSVLPTSPEPEDVAWRGTHTLYVVDDDRNRIDRIRPGRDDRIGTAGDRRKTVAKTKSFGSRDPEGLAWRERGRVLIVTDARSARFFIVRAGGDRRFSTGDDAVRGTLAPSRADPAVMHLLIVGKGVDNASDPHENDGELFRFAYPG